MTSGITALTKGYEIGVVYGAYLVVATLAYLVAATLDYLVVAALAYLVVATLAYLVEATLAYLVVATQAYRVAVTQKIDPKANGSYENTKSKENPQFGVERELLAEFTDIKRR
ncbi:hypothetical protein PInf_007593 [Phytophthora infestans]|nr:hypothetical protein PInf_007593 [Phytophthora infestans]